MSGAAEGRDPSAGSLRRAHRAVAALLPRRADWTQASPRRDLLAGVTVGLVALPLALGFGVSSGLGAGAGLTTAIIAGAVAAVFGGSRVQVSGPTGAMTVVLLPIIAAHGASGVLVVGMMAGVLLIGLGFAKVGRYIRYVPVPVVEGFTLGIAVIIAAQQLPAALGVHVHASKIAVVAADAAKAWARNPTWSALGLTAAVVAVTLIVAWARPTLPASLIAVVLATAANQIPGLGLATLGRLPHGLSAPRFPAIGMGELGGFVLPALAVAALAALESLLSATASDAMSVGQRHNPDRELVGQGLANLAAPLFGGMPATAALARTAVNVRAGATSRLASLTHAAFVLAVMLAAGAWVARIPLAALAGVLIATAIQMVRVSSLRAVVRSTRGDAIVLIATAITTVAFDLVTAVVTGLVIAGFFALRQTATSARIDEVPLDDVEHASEEQLLRDESIVAYRLDGPLFFATAHDFLLELTSVARVKVVILRMSRITALDATGAHVLVDIVDQLEHRGITVMVSGIRRGHDTILAQLDFTGHLAHENHIFATTPEAIKHARLHAARIAHTPRAS